MPPQSRSAASTKAASSIFSTASSGRPPAPSPLPAFLAARFAIAIPRGLPTLPREDMGWPAALPGARGLTRQFPRALGRGEHGAGEEGLEAVLGHEHVEGGAGGAAGAGDVLAQL